MCSKELWYRVWYYIKLFVKNPFVAKWEISNTSISSCVYNSFRLNHENQLEYIFATLDYISCMFVHTRTNCLGYNYDENFV